MADQDIHKKHRNDLSKMDIQKEEYHQLIFNEEKLTKEYATKAQGYLGRTTAGGTPCDLQWLEAGSYTA